MTPSDVADLIRVMLDRTADFDDRWDAVAQFSAETTPGLELPVWAKDDAAMDALTELGSRSDEDPQLRRFAGEALGLTWLESGSIDSDRYARLGDDARAEVRAYMKANERFDLLSDLE